MDHSKAAAHYRGLIEQLALEPRVTFEVTVRHHGRELYHTESRGSDRGKRGAQLEMARIVAAQLPGSKVSFKRVPLC